MHRKQKTSIKNKLEWLLIISTAVIAMVSPCTHTSMCTMLDATLEIALCTLECYSGETDDIFILENQKVKRQQAGTKQKITSNSAESFRGKDE